MELVCQIEQWGNHGWVFYINGKNDGWIYPTFEDAAEAASVHKTKTISEGLKEDQEQGV